jgi:acyl-CoA thioesterase-1
MHVSRSNRLLLCLLFVSVVMNAVTGVQLRRAYVAFEVLAAEPTHERLYVSQNEAVRQHGSGRPLLVLFGDSRMQRWQPAPQFAGYETLNRGVGGETTAQMLHRFRADVLDLEPRVVVLEAGVNDLVAAGLSPDRAAAIAQRTVENLEQMVQRARGAHIRVVLLSILPPGPPDLVRRLVWSERIAHLVGDCNQQMAKFENPPAVHIIDTARLLQDDTGRWKPGMLADTLHVTPAAYVQLQAAVQAVLTSQQ